MQMLLFSKGYDVVTIWNSSKSCTSFPTALVHALEALLTPPNGKFPFSSTLYSQIRGAELIQLSSARCSALVRSAFQSHRTPQDWLFLEGWKD